MSKYISGLFYEFGASSKKYDEVAARVERSEARLAELRDKNIEAQEKAMARLDAFKLEYSQNEDRLREAKLKGDNKAISATIKRLKELDVEYITLEADAQASAQTRENAEKRAQKALGKSQDELKKIKSSYSVLGSALKKIGPIAAGAFSIAGISSFINKLDDLSKRARDIDMTASQLQELQHQADKAGISASELDTAMKAFNRNVSLAAMGTGEARIALESMGISLENANGIYKDQNELLQETAMYFAQNANEAENAGRAAKLFGENGAEVLRIFEQGEDSVNKVFNAKGIDEAALAAEKLNNTFKDFFNSIKDGVAILAGKGAEAFGIIEKSHQLSERSAEKLQNWKDSQRIKEIEREISEIKNVGRSGLGKTTLSTEAQDRIRIEEIVTELKGVNSEIFILNDREKKSREDMERLLIAYKDRNALEAEGFEIKKRIQKLDASNKAEEDIYSRMKNEQESKAIRKENFELQTKINLLEAQGKTREAESLKFANDRNKLMKEYGYSLEQATRIQTLLNEAEKKKGGVEYSDEAKERARKILERGKGGSVGKRTMEEAKAISEGREVEGGFRTAMFSKLTNGAADKRTLKNINIDTQSEAKRLDSEAKSIEDKNAKVLEDLKKAFKENTDLLKDIKNYVGSVVQNRSEETVAL